MWLSRTPATARPPHGHEPGRDRRHPPGGRDDRAAGGAGAGANEARAEEEGRREGGCGGKQRAGQLRRTLADPGREEGAGPRSPHHCPGFIIYQGTCSRFFNRPKIELGYDRTSAR